MYSNAWTQNEVALNVTFVITPKITFLCKEDNDVGC